MNQRCLSIAIDGPAGAGKSTLARRSACRFGFLYVDTGAIYRTVGLAAQRAGLTGKEEAAVAALLPGLEITLRYDEHGVQRMYLNGEDVTGLIRSPEISMMASNVSALPAVRAFLLDMQRSLARTHSVIMDGRDIGTVVLPDADLKVFLTASPEDRAARRLKELQGRGVETTLEEVLEDIRRRDHQDSTRAAAPLRPAADAVLLDTSGNTVQQSVELIGQIIEARLHIRPEETP